MAKGIPVGQGCEATTGCSKLAAHNHHMLRDDPSYKIHVDGRQMRDHQVLRQYLCSDCHLKTGHEKHEATMKWPIGYGTMANPWRI